MATKYFTVQNCNTFLTKVISNVQYMPITIAIHITSPRLLPTKLYYWPFSTWI